MDERESEIREYLATGDHDPLHPVWGGDIIESGRRANEATRDALIAEVRQRTEGRPPPRVPANLDLAAFIRAKVEPMVKGLFPEREREPVLSTLVRSVVFLTPDNVEGLLRTTSWPRTAWNLANLYLASVGAAILGTETPQIVGLSEETTCYVSCDYFSTEGRFDDFILHEAAHVFHNCKRRTIGLPETRTREWLLNIDFGMRETFAYACEAYSRIRRAGTEADWPRRRREGHLQDLRVPYPADRRNLLDGLTSGPMPVDELVDEGEYLSILAEAVAARSGWKRILARCAPGARAVGLTRCR